MISISQKKMGFITKMSLSILSIYTIFFVAYRVTTYYNILNEKERLTLELIIIKMKMIVLKRL